MPWDIPLTRSGTRLLTFRNRFVDASGGVLRGPGEVRNPLNQPAVISPAPAFGGVTIHHAFPGQIQVIMTPSIRRALPLQSPGWPGGRAAPRTRKSKRPERPAIGALPVDPAASEPPEVFFHAVVAYLKAARAGPAERLCLSATAADILAFSAPPPRRPGLFHGDPLRVRSWGRVRPGD